VDGRRAALGTVIDTNGHLLTKASELKSGKVTCTLSNGREVPGTVVATDDDNDVALVKISVTGLKPIAWASTETSVGQWVATPGLGATPEAVGIVSVHPRKILPKRAMIGVELAGTNDSPARITGVTPGFGAAKAGLQSGDIILAVNGVTVTNRQGLTDKLREVREGKTVRLRVQRDTKEFEAVVEMTAESKVMAVQYGLPRRFGRGFDRQDLMNHMGSDVSERAEDFSLAIQHDTVLEPWQCGGPLVNLEGKAVGLNIARAGRVASYALPASLVKHIIQDLEAKVVTPNK
jgi:serine protease Do